MLFVPAVVVSVVVAFINNTIRDTMMGCNGKMQHAETIKNVNVYR
jgi:hypothetical protein